jgi:hypothetical protein
MPSQNPATSSRGNYVAFESADPSIDPSVAPRANAGVQVYVRYLGPK